MTDGSKWALGLGVLTVAGLGGALWWRGRRPARASRGEAPQREVAAVVLCGPVNLVQMPGEVPGVPAFVLTCTGDGHPSCGEHADGWKDRDGRRLPGLRAALKLPPGPLAIRAFSAGGHIVRRLVEHPADRAELAAVQLADATYTTERDGRGRARPIQSLVDLARDAADGHLLLVATASPTPNPSSQHKGVVYPSGAETLAAIREALALERPIARRECGAEVCAGAEVFGAGDVWFMEYPQSVSHEEHAKVLGPRIWEQLVGPHLRAPKGETK